ncbi:hypothetical protein HDR59_03725 [bacterium]|nr:hypothetical protein [bacterium]
MRNKIKLSLIAIATLVASNVNAQTYYSCIPEGCPAGQYFDGKKCLSIENLISDQMCPPGYIVVNMKCCKNEPYDITIIVDKRQKEPVVSAKGVKFKVTSAHVDDDFYGANIYPDDYVEYLYSNAGSLKLRRTYGKCQEFTSNNLFLDVK